MNAQPVLMTVTQKQSVAIQLVHSLAVVTKDTQGMEKIVPVGSQFLYKVYTFSLSTPQHTMFPFCNEMSKQSYKTAPISNLLEYFPNFCTHYMLCSYSFPQ